MKESKAPSQMAVGLVKDALECGLPCLLQWRYGGTKRRCRVGVVSHAHQKGGACPYVDAILSKSSGQE